MAKEYLSASILPALAAFSGFVESMVLLLGIVIDDWTAGESAAVYGMLRAWESPPPGELLQQIAGVTQGSIFHQLVSSDPEIMQSKPQAANAILGDRLVLKTARSETGFRIIKDHPEYRCCPTAIFSASQALVTREAGAACRAMGYHWLSAAVKFWRALPPREVDPKNRTVA